ncbi:cell division protein FtsA [Thermosediminibacter oceani]|uniref:Cell division protein FtsA n=1 Tax=Thermosediminibacter oceani (strain ATCC BAA-1034 / DSM 16646 / JW/IW-1228P) TaxID=555079 RepID=D9S2U3_THEOJ|nr:cell division protein FtsA [Thermosediminibacter oceani]ADL07720.1 cell division protein FtsA [Thermosediminibacter oceani DSM 16646]
MGRNNILASLDLGSSKVCCMIGEISRSGEIDIIGYGIAPTTGIKKGIIVNIEAMVRSIVEAVEQAEQMSNAKVTSVLVGISGNNVTVINNRGVVAIPRSDREITLHDVERVIQVARIVAIPPDREIIEVLPKQFIVDGCDGIRDPVGMVGTRLEVEASIITGQLTAIQNVVRCVQKAGLEVEGITLKSLAAREILLSDDELDMGVALVDVGAGTTEITVFRGNSIALYSLIPLGGDYITNDIAIGLRLPYSQAEAIKRKYGCAMVSQASDKPDIEIQSIGESNTRRISQKELAAIIEPRVQEIISMIYKELKDLDYRAVLAAGAVLSGSGLLYMRGALEIAQKMLGIPVRAARTDMYGYDHTFTVALGLIYYGYKQRSFTERNGAKEKNTLSIFEKAKRFLKEYF